jgi:hypothetical protein
MKAYNVTPRLGLVATGTIYLFNVKLRCNTRHEARETVALDTLIYFEGDFIPQICCVMTLHMTEILELKQGKACLS